MPSTVVRRPPSAWAASMKQDLTGWPSRRMVQAPQIPCSQPRCVPVSRNRSRRKSASSIRAGTMAVTGLPFTSSDTSTVAVGSAIAFTATPLGDQTRSWRRWELRLHLVDLALKGGLHESLLIVVEPRGRNADEKRFMQTAFEREIDE